MDDEKKNKKTSTPLDKVLADIVKASKLRTATRKAAITKMRSDRAIARRNKRKNTTSTVKGLQGLFGFGHQKK